MIDNNDNLCAVAFIGAPNSGKSSLMNKLSGAKCKTGNWFGVTLKKEEKKCGEIKYIDLPGIEYFPKNKNECIEYDVVGDTIEKNNIDIFINVVDATSLRRDLVFTIELIMRYKRVIVVINKKDSIEEKGLEINLDNLSAQLGCKVFIISSRNKEDIQAIKNYLCEKSSLICSQKQNGKAIDELSNDYQILFRLIYNEVKYRNKPISSNDLSWCKIFSKKIVLSVTKGQSFKDDKSLDEDSTKKYMEEGAISKINRLIAENKIPKEYLIYLRTIVNASFEKYQPLSNDIVNENLQYISRKTFASNIGNKISSKSEFKNLDNMKKNITEFLDQISLNFFYSLPIFIFLLYCTFYLSILSINTLSEPLAHYADFIISNPIIYLIKHIPIMPYEVKSLISEGVKLGIGTIISFLPGIWVLYTFLFFLEESGYMTRVSLMMNNCMKKVGLPGHAIIPLVLGLGCNVISIPATAAIHNKKSRIICVMMVPFMTCSSRFVVFVTLGSIFFKDNVSLMILILYLIGLFFSIGTGIILKIFFKLESAGKEFIVRLPQYTLPSIKVIFNKVMLFSSSFVFGIGKSIIIAFIAFSFLSASHISLNPFKVTRVPIEKSIISDIGKSMKITKYIGIDENNWEANVALISGAIAKEIIVSSLISLYEIGQADIDNPRNRTAEIDKNNLDKIGSSEILTDMKSFSKKNLQTYSSQFNRKFPTNKSAFCFLVFVLLCFPCASLFISIKKEIGILWATISVMWSLISAFGTSALIWAIPLSF